MRKLLITFVFVLMASMQCLFAQTTVKGTVTNAEDGQEIVGVSVIIKGTQIGTVTDIDGFYTIDVPADRNTLVFSFVGMETKEVQISSGTKTVNVALEPSTTSLEEVVITGYAVTTKKAFTGSASTLLSDKIKEKKDINPIKALEATVPGLQMNTSSGQPGAPSNILIRGRGSINSGTQPLYVIDGVPMEAGTWGMRASEGQEFTPLANLNPNDIETITVLKDATATSIYGSRAANGVIVITTKSGKRGSGTQINFDVSLGWEDLPNFTNNYKLTNKSEYLELWYEAIKNISTNEDGSPYTTEQAKADFWDLADWYFEGEINEENAADVNWLDEVTRKGFVQDYNFSISSPGKGKNAPNYYFSFNRTDNKAFIRGKDFEKTSLTFNLNHSPIDLIEYGVNNQLSFTKINMGAGGGYFSDPITQAYMQAPITPVYIPGTDGEFNFNTVNGYNPVAQRSEYGDKSRAENYGARIIPYVRFNIIPGLTFTTKGSLDFMYINEFGYWSFMQPQGADMNGMGENGTDRHVMLSINNLLNYVKSFDGKHNLHVMLGQEAQSTHQYSTYLYASNYPSPFMNEISLAATPGGAETYQYDLRLASFFSNFEYDFSNKYYVSASFRVDGSSRFGTNNKWAPFWSIGGKYRIINEEFMDNAKDWLTDLTIRASYGTSGNQEVGGSWYAARRLYGFGWNYNSNAGAYIEQVGNPDLRWEKIGKFNVGFDFGLYNRVNLAFDYYNHLTTDMVFEMPISMASGMGSVLRNIGSMQNSGVEVSLNAKIFNQQNFTWDFTAVASHNKNVVKELSTDMPIEYTYQIIEPGHDFYTFKMKEYAGVDPETGNAMWYLNETGDETTFEYNKAAKRYLGSASPKLQGSFINSFNIYDFDFSFQFNYSVGGMIYANHLRYDEQTGSAYFNAFTRYVYENRWQQPGDVTDVPKMAWGDNSASRHSSRYLFKGDYLKLQNVVLGYTLPRDITSKIRIDKIRLYFVASNVFTVASKEYRGFDPAGIGPNGVQWWNYPTPRKFMFGINVNF